MRGGRLRHHVEIQRATESRDAHGGVTLTWTTIGKRWASIEPISGREFFWAKQVSAATTHRVRMRHYAGLTPKDRIKHGDRCLNIESIINPEERNVELELVCAEEV